MTTTKIIEWNKTFRIILFAILWLLKTLLKVILTIGSFFIAFFFGEKRDDEHVHHDDEGKDYR